MKHIISAVVIITLLHTSCSDKCVTENFKVVWRIVETSDGHPGQILDVHTNDPRIINVASHQKINEICQNTLKNLDSLYVLKLDSSGITRIEPGSFQNNHKLYYLDLNKNNIERISSGVFTGTNFRILKLNHNKITHIDTNALDDMTRLEIIDLSHNEIENLDGDWFKNSNKMNHLILSHNHIKILNANVFKNLKHITELPDDKPLNIDLGHNKIQTIDPKAFAGLEELGNLDLNDNEIAMVDENTFSMLNRVKTLHLGYNKLECISGNLDFLKKVSNIHLTHNPWSCVCVEKLRNWFKNHGGNIGLIYESIKCFLANMKQA